MTVVYWLWAPEGQIIEQDYMFSPSSFFYIHSDCGSCGHRARFVHTYIIL